MYDCDPQTKPVFAKNGCTKYLKEMPQARTEHVLNHPHRGAIGNWHKHRISVKPTGQSVGSAPERLWDRFPDLSMCGDRQSRPCIKGIVCGVIGKLRRRWRPPHCRENHQL